MAERDSVGVPLMIRANDSRPIRMPQARVKDAPLCERCGRPVKVDNPDYVREEVLCLACAADYRVPEAEETDYQRGWT
jgi:hypothetical protein